MNLDGRSKTAQQVKIRLAKKPIPVTSYYFLVKKYGKDNDTKVDFELQFPQGQDNAINVIGFDEIYKGYKHYIKTQFRNKIGAEEQVSDTVEQLQKKLNVLKPKVNLKPNYWTSASTSPIKKAEKEIALNMENMTPEQKLAEIDKMIARAKSQ